jgi:hypothetical protein
MYTFGGFFFVFAPCAGPSAKEAVVDGAMDDFVYNLLCCCVPHLCLLACYSFFVHILDIIRIRGTLNHYPDDAPCIPTRLGDLAQP